MATEAAPGIVDQLRRIDAGAPIVVSCYVRLDVPHRTRKRYHSLVKSAARRLLAGLSDRGLTREQVRGVRGDVARVVEWLSRPARLPPQRGVAVFACGPLELFEVVPLPREHRVRIDVDRAPLLHELLDARERMGRYLAVVVDARRARFFEVAAEGAVELPALRSEARGGGRYRADRRDAPGWGERQYHNRVATERRRHYAAAGDRAVRLLRSRRLQGVAVLGSRDHTTALVDAWSQPLRDRLLGTGRLAATYAGPDDVSRATWQLQGERERADEARLVGAMERDLDAGLAVNGARETLRALARGQVRTLIVPAARNGGGYRCSSTGRLALARADCRGEGTPQPVPSLVDAAIDDALRRRGDVRVIDDPDLARRIDGLAATLRFAES
jgi:peptide subunit release factor 1 (eRF1)